MKPQRIVDQELLEAVRNLPCMACADADPHAAWEAVHDHGIRVHPHHLISVAAGGHDIYQNVMPLCFKHHSEIHRIGLASMADKYTILKSWLIAAEWDHPAPRIWNHPIIIPNDAIISLPNRTSLVTEKV